jgi:hypothetical protein
VVTVPRGEREAVQFVAVCLMKVSVEQHGDKEGRAEHVKLSGCVIQHRAVEVYALVKIHLDAFEHEVSYRHALTGLPLGNRRLAEPQSPSVLCWPSAGWDLSDVPGRAKRIHGKLASSYQVRTPRTCRMHEVIFVYPTFTTMRPVVT